MVKITFPTNSSTAKAGIMFAAPDKDNGWSVIINRNISKIALHQVTSGSLRQGGEDSVRSIASRRPS